MVWGPSPRAALRLALLVLGLLPLAAAAIPAAGALGSPGPHAPPAPGTNWTLTASPGSAAVGQPVTLTATEFPGQAGETVSFLNANGGPIAGCQNLGTVNTGSGYAATCRTSFTQSGNNSLNAFFYAGGSPRGSASLNYQVTSGAPTRVDLSSSSPAPKTHESFTLTATIVPTGPHPAGLTGTVTFLDHQAAIGACSSQAVGIHPPSTSFQAQCQLAYGSPGQHSFTARYSGDQTYTGSTSSPLSVSVGTIASGQLAPCAGQDETLRAASIPRARAAVLCLLNEIRARYGVSPFSTSSALSAFAQDNPGTAKRPPYPGERAAALLSNDLGVRTPYAVVAGWLRQHSGCFDILAMNAAGVGVVNRPVIAGLPQRGAPLFGAAPTWTLALAQTQPLQNASAVMSCPHPIPVDAAGQGRAPAGRAPAGDLAFIAARRSGQSLALLGAGQIRHTVKARIVVSVGRVRVAARTVSARYHRNLLLGFRLSGAAAAAAHPGAIVKVAVSERSPRPATQLWLLRL